MNDLTDIYATKFGNVTYAEPVSETPLADIFRTAERSTRLTGNMVSEAASREEAYDNRIRAIKTATGIELENPERGGYAIDARKAIRQAVIAGGMSPIDETGGIPAYQKRIFDQKVADLQVKHPDLTDTITGGVGEEARALAAGSARDFARATDQPVNPILKFGAEFAGGAWGSRRDPIFLGSLFAGPTSAVGRTAFARVASSALNQGLFNAGITAMEQPTVQDWHKRIGQESGVLPALKDVGMAFVLGMIPGAAIEGLKEAAVPLRRLLAGRPEAGDVAKAWEHLGPPSEAPAAEPATTKSSPDPAVAFPDARNRSGMFILPIAGDKGNFEFTVEGNVVTARGAHLDEAERGKGLAAATYQRVADWALDSGKIFRSVGAPSKDAARIYEGLGKRGYTVERTTDPVGRVEYAITGKPPTKSEDLNLRTMRAGEDSIAADRAVLTEPAPKDIPEDLHHDLIGAALKRADDPSAPSPEAVAAVQQLRTPTEPRVSDQTELQDRILQAAPQTEREAHVAADEALDDLGRRDGMAALRENVEQGKTAETESVKAAQPAEPEKLARGDPMGKVPFIRDDGTVEMLAPPAIAKIGERESTAAMLVRSCV